MKIKFTGTGDGRGIPSIGCRCSRCMSARTDGGKDRRRRTSVIVTNNDNSDIILYDTPSSIGQIISEEEIFHITAIFLSHKHFDHIGGLTDFEYWPEKIPVYGNMSTLGNFEITKMLYDNCRFQVLHTKEAVEVNSIKITPFDVEHSVPTYGLIFQEGSEKIVHFSDKSDGTLNDYESREMEDADIAVFHTVAYDKADGHIDVLHVLKIAEKFPSTKIVLTHIAHNNLPHADLEKAVSSYANVIVAYDGLALQV